MERRKNAKRGIVFGYINQSLNLICPFITRTVIIYKMGAEYVGLGGLFTSILGILNVTELGFGSALAYVLYGPIANGDDLRVRKILSFSKVIFRCIGSIVLVMGLIVTPFIKNLVRSDIPNDLNIYILFLLYLCSTVLSYFLFSYKRILLNACQRYDVEVSIQAIVTVTQCIIQAGIIVFTRNYYLFVIVSVVASVLNNITIEIMSKRIFPQYYCEGEIEKIDRDNIVQKVKGIFASRIGATVFSSVDNIVISAYFGLVILGQFNNYYYIQMSVMGFFAIIHNVLRPIIGNKVQLEDKKQIFNVQKVITYIYLILTFGCGTLLLVLYQDFIRLWIGEKNMMDIFIVILCTILFLVSRISSIPQLFTEAMGLWWESRYINIIGAICNLIINIILCSVIGVYGIIISSIVCICTFNFEGFIRILFKYYYMDISMRKEYTRQIILETIKGIIGIILAYSAVQFIIVTNWGLFLLKGLTAAIIYILYIVFCELIIQHNLDRINWAIKFIGIER